MHKDGDQVTIQYRTYQHLRRILPIFNDDGSGEAADLVRLKDPMRHQSASPRALQGGARRQSITGHPQLLHCVRSGPEVDYGQARRPTDALSRLGVPTGSMGEAGLHPFSTRAT